ncbi:MAG TPA: hypothetical protein VJX67_06720 [Blastocatellia bacterium]|nr:hypothetical protein [Blastocatellia bacterium]
MSFDAETLYQLIPAIYRIRDAELGGPLKALLTVIAGQTAVLEEDLSQLYDDQFIETCAAWVVPYIGDLVGASGLRSSGLGTLAPRAEVARTLAYRRRKGTAAVIQQLAHDVTGWPARAVEYFQLLATTQFMNHLRPGNQSFISLKNAERLQYLGGPFEHLDGTADLAHTADVRRIDSSRGRYNIPNVGVFLWRIQANSSTESPAVPDSGNTQLHFRFNPLGIDAPLFSLPATEGDLTRLAGPLDVPDRIGRRFLKANLEGLYGTQNSIVLYSHGTAVLPDPNKPGQQLSDLITVCDLSDWTRGSTTRISIDPVLGRVSFPPGQEQSSPPKVSYYYGFAANIGGGEYGRATSFDPEPTDSSKVKLNLVPSSKFSTIQDALNDIKAGEDGIVEIIDNGIYQESITINATGRRIELRAGDQRRPALIVNSRIEIKGGPDDHVSLNGLLISGGSLEAGDAVNLAAPQLGSLSIRHCTLVPGISLAVDGHAAQPGVPSLVISSPIATVEISSSIIGGVTSGPDVKVNITGSIVDATSPTLVAFSGADQNSPGGILRFQNCTVIGKVNATMMDLVSNSLLIAALIGTEDKSKWPASVIARKRQQGCARFSLFPAGAITPRRFKCQPTVDASEGSVRPVFESLRYTDPGYCLLRPDSPVEIRQGADDESEMGVFHDLYQPQKESHLRARIEEYLRFGLEAGIFYAT